MKRLTCWLLGISMLGLVPLAPIAAQGRKNETPTPPRQVQDDGGFFSEQAKEKANAIIRQIKSRHHKDLFIEVAPTIGVKLEKNASGEEKKEADIKVTKWAREHFDNLQVNGVYIGIVADLHKFRIRVGTNTGQHLFTAENEKEAEKIMIEKLKAGKKDDALLAVANYVSDAMDKNVPAKGAQAPVAKVPPVHQDGPRPAAQPVHHQPETSEFPQWLIWVGIALAALLVFWLIMGLARAATGGGGGGYGGAPGMGGGGGGGFFSSLLGGMFGAAAGMWMYNNFFGGHQSSAHAGDFYGGGGADAGSSDPSDVGAGSTGGGGDWGDGGGGGDAGGGGDFDKGDAGGGDFDKGDAGGGGDWGGDAGGGGGDWGGGGGGDFGGGGGDFGGGGGGDW